MIQNVDSRDFSGGPEVNALHFQGREEGSIPGQGNKIPQCHTAPPPKKGLQKVFFFF